MKIYIFIILILMLLGIGVWFFLPKKPSSNTVISLEQLSLHNSASDCWTVIDNNLYDITKFIPMHPGKDKILVACGKDATSDFKNAGVRGHLTKGVALLAGMKIGSLK